MAQGLPPLDANIVDLQNDIPEDEEDWEAELPPDFALIGTLGSAMLKEKHGPDGKITSYQVHIVTGGHRQVEGVNHSKTFSSTAKMPLWAEAGRLWVVPGNEPGPHKGSWIHLFHC